MAFNSTVTRFAALVILAFSGAAHSAELFNLVTKDEVAAEKSFEAKQGNAPSASARGFGIPAQGPATPPFIKVIAPAEENQPIVSPMRIELAFETTPDAHVVPNSFRVLYGLLKIDITEKLRPYAAVTEHGLVAENAAIPVGSHRLFVQISDSVGRTAMREIKFTVDSAASH